MEIVFLDSLSLTLASELMASLEAVRASRLGGGTVAVKTIRGRQYVYLQRMVNGQYRYTYVGPKDAVDVESLKRSLAASRSMAKQERQKQKRIADFLLKAGVVPVDAEMVRLMKVLDKEDVLSKVVILGTTAFLAYQTVLGFVPLKAHRTLDVDLMRDKTLTIATQEALPIAGILERAGIEFVPESPLGMKFPVRLRLSSGLSVDLLCPKMGSQDFLAPVESGFLEVGAQAIPHARILTERTSRGMLIYPGSAFMVFVPHPLAFVLHKAIAFLKRPADQAAKKDKDRWQARAVLKAYTRIHGHEETVEEVKELLTEMNMKAALKERVGKICLDWMKE